MGTVKPSITLNELIEELEKLDGKEIEIGIKIVSKTFGIPYDEVEKLICQKQGSL